MKFSLSKLLEKRGINNVEDLTPEEQVVYERYKTILSGDSVTIDSLKDFCHAQIRIIEARFASPDDTHDIYLKACLHVYLNLLKAIEAPEAERESLEKHLTQLIQA